MDLLVKARLVVGIILVLRVPALLSQSTIDRESWPAYGRDLGGSRYAPLDEITRGNVNQLRLAWIARTGDYLTDRGRFEATPILVKGTLYVSTPLGSVVALDPATGVERWKFDGGVQFGYNDYGDFANRGVSAWMGGSQQRCSLRIFVATVDARLIALDGATGRPCAAHTQRRYPQGVSASATPHHCHRRRPRSHPRARAAALKFFLPSLCADLGLRHRAAPVTRYSPVLAS